MAIENATLRRLGSLSAIGKAGLNIAYPKEFELYLCALEVTTADYRTLQYFVFPVMPTNFDESQTFLSSVKKTLGGVVVTSSQGFVPRDIVLAGTFGRKFRTLLGGDYVDVISSFKVDGKVTLNSLIKGVGEVFDERVKTGYGCLKVLEEIINNADVIDELGPRKLILHNPALGNSYLIKPQSLKLSQNQDTNMIWGYSLSMKAVASLEDIMNSQELKKQRERLVLTGYMQSKVDDVIGSISKAISKI